MEYSKENIMTRKEYLKSKKKNKFDFSKIKYVLIVIVIILLSVYLFKQLDVYNNVTKIANKVVEETALAKTMTMFYVSEPYTREDEKTVMLYKSSDESRTKIPNSQNLTNIKVDGNNLYGIRDNKLYSINLETYEVSTVTEDEVRLYDIHDGVIYYYTEQEEKDGVYKIVDGKAELIISDDATYLLVKDKYIYLISSKKTSATVVRYNLDGKNAKELSDTHIVKDMAVDNNSVYYINSKDSKIYKVAKNGGDITCITNNEAKITDNDSIVIYEDNIFYVNSKDNNNLYRINLQNSTDEKVIAKSIKSMQIDKNIIYYMVQDNIGIFKYDVITGKTSQVTSARTK